MEKGTLRSLSSFDGMIDFVSNDYLGLRSFNVDHPNTGATGSRLISGNSRTMEAAEQSLADFFGSESALCFNSGYDANVGVFSAVPQRGDVILYDEFIHASVRDGIRLSWAKSYAFQHNDLEDLVRLLDKFSEQTIYVAVEGLYSMDGDICHLRAVSELTKKHNAYLIVDEAHSSGVFGTNGKGLTYALGLESDVFLRLTTFGKAYGGHGAVALCSSDLRSYLLNFARSFIYTTALPEKEYIRMQEVVQISDLNQRRIELQENLKYFRQKLKNSELMSVPNSPIQVIQFGDLDRLRNVEMQLAEQGIAAKAIYSPTVPEGMERIRLCVHSFNTKEDIQKLTSLLDL